MFVHLVLSGTGVLRLRGDQCRCRLVYVCVSGRSVKFRPGRGPAKTVATRSIFLGGMGRGSGRGVVCVWGGGGGGGVDLHGGTE